MSAFQPPPVCAPPRPTVGHPRRPAPAGSVDTHAHIFPVDASDRLTSPRTYTPSPAPLAQYQAMLDRLGVTHAVLVQPSVYGFDNAVMLDVLGGLAGRWRGVAVVPPTIDSAALQAMHRVGVRGVRANLMFRGGLTRDTLEELVQLIAPLGWHLQVLADVSADPDLLRVLSLLPVPVVFDHMGHVPARRGPDDPGFRAMLGLLRRGRAWVKLSGAYRLTGSGDPSYPDVAPFARAILAEAADRAVWGSDWPHPHIDTAMPDDAALLDLLDDWTADAGTRDAVLSGNARRLYGFDL